MMYRESHQVVFPMNKEQGESLAIGGFDIRKKEKTTISRASLPRVKYLTITDMTFYVPFGKLA